MPTPAPPNNPTVSTLNRHVERTAVVESGGVRRLIATQAFESGETILDVRGTMVEIASRYSIQAQENAHIIPSHDPVPLGTHDAYAWRYLNHSCNPNATLINLKLVALRPILASEEITFDYNTNEYEMATPFTCNCGSCGGSEIRGFRFLPSEKQKQLYPRLAEHLRYKLRGHGVV